MGEIVKLPTVVPVKKKTSAVLVNWPEMLKKKPRKGSMMNVLAAVAALKLDCTFDTFRGRYYIHGFGMSLNAVTLDDKLGRAFRAYCFKHTGYEPGKEATREGLQLACERHPVNRVVDYLSSLSWDGVPRLDRWLTTYLGVEDTPLHRQFARLTLIAACRRPHEPGCKFDHVLVLEGAENQGKSAVGRILAGAERIDAPCVLFSDATLLDKDEKNQKELLEGVWFYELSELAGLAKADQKKVKAFITKQQDVARAAYDFFRTEQLRCGVMYGTVNTDTVTGETIPYLNLGDRRRWWPAHSKWKRFDLERLLRDRDQLFAEAMAVGLRDDFSGWVSLVLPDEFHEAAGIEQVAREMEHPWTPFIAPLFNDLSKADGGAEDGPPSTDGDVEYTADHIGVASRYVLTQIPVSIRTNGQGLPGIMAKYEWRMVKKNTGNWYYHARKK
jgi:hypothetical protein